jgi:flagellar basal-body rod protein FlgG
MGSSLYHAMNISRQDLMTRLQDLDVISNNLSNINMPGFKANRANFQEVLSATQKEGIYMPGTSMLMSQGEIVQSENPLDCAINGDGFFQLKLPNGQTGYTRDGRLHLDSNRSLVSLGGATLIWQGTIPVDSVGVSITGNGTVEVTKADGTKAAAGTIQLAQFPNPSGLVAVGGNIWTASAPSGAARTGVPGSGTLGNIQGKSIEQSNVDMTREVTAMMADQRNFQLSTRVLQQTDLMIAQAINLRKG